jgi:hypothetical protein
MRRPGPTGSATTVTSGSLPAFYRTSPVQASSASVSCGQISQPCAIVLCSTAARPLIPPPRPAVRRNESPTLRFRAQSVPSRLPRSNSSSVSRGPCATRLHKRNAAGPRCPCPKRSGHKAIPGCLCIHAAQIRAWDAPRRLPTKCRCPRHHIARAQTIKAIRCFVHSGCTNSGLRRSPGILPESVCVPESPTGTVTCSRLLGLCHHRPYSRFVR